MPDVPAIHFPTRRQSASHYHAWCSALILAIAAFGVAMLAWALLHEQVDATTTPAWMAVLCALAIPVALGVLMGTHCDAPDNRVGVVAETPVAPAAMDAGMDP